MTERRPYSCGDHHPDEPEGYVARAEWHEQMAETHDCYWCGECLLWKIWEPKAS